jgi:tRNA pseudouridine55 synthase
VARSRAIGDGTFDGILVVDKPVGPTSHDQVDLVRRLTGVRRVGHGGTLDPFAGGVLPIFIGRATRLVEYHMRDDKDYRATIAFGASSTTDDLDGELAAGEGSIPTQAEVEAALSAFRGSFSQVPPDHSAVRVQGRHAYELARAGDRPTLVARQVTVDRLEVLDWDGTHADRPTATLEISCSAGTYIRAIARDLGSSLGCGAYLVALTRTRSGPFRRSQAHAPDAIRAAFATDRGRDLLLPSDAGLDAFPVTSLEPLDLEAILRGQVVRAPAEAGGGAIDDGRQPAHWRVRDREGRLAAIARLESGRLHPEKVLLDPAPRS